MAGTVTRPAPTPVLVAALWILWGSAFLAIKAGVSVARPEVFTFLRVLAAVLVLAAALGVRRLRSTPLERQPGLHRYALALGATNVVGFVVLQSAGLARMGIGLGALLIYTYPLFVTILARVALHEHLAPRQIAGVLVGWAGIAAATTGQARGGSVTAVGTALLLGSAAMWAAGTVVARAMPPHLPLLDVLFWQNLYGLAALAVVVLAARPSLTPSFTLIASALVVGGGASVAGFALLYTLLRRGAAGVVSSWIFAVPVISAALGVVVRGESLEPGLVVGGAAVCVALWLARPGVPPPGA